MDVLPKERYRAEVWDRCTQCGVHCEGIDDNSTPCLKGRPMSAELHVAGLGFVLGVSLLRCPVPEAEADKQHTTSGTEDALQSDCHSVSGPEGQDID